MKVAICDDRSQDRAQVVSILSALRSAWRYKSYASGEELLEDYENGAIFDLIFLDIYMGGMDGMAAAHALRRYDSHAALVFLTTSRDFAVESYAVEALSYLVKPVDEKALLGVLNRFETAYHPKSILLRDRLFVARDIVHMESRDKKVIISFRDGTCSQINARMDEVEEQLVGHNFLRCHRSFIVNMDAVMRLDGREFLMSTGARVPIRRQDFSQICGCYFDYVTSL